MSKKPAAKPRAAKPKKVFVRVVHPSYDSAQRPGGPVVGREPVEVEAEYARRLLAIEDAHGAPIVAKAPKP